MIRPPPGCTLEQNFRASSAQPAWRICMGVCALATLHATAAAAVTTNSNDKGFIGDLNKIYASIEMAYLPSETCHQSASFVVARIRPRSPSGCK